MRKPLGNVYPGKAVKLVLCPECSGGKASQEGKEKCFHTR
jgi:hypothetical protein